MKTINGLRVCRAELVDIQIDLGVDGVYMSSFQSEMIKLESGGYLFIKGNSYHWVPSSNIKEIASQEIDDRKTANLLDAIGFKPSKITIEF